MAETLLQILPFIALAILGYLLKTFNILKAEHADIIIRIVFYLGLPALILTVIPALELTRELFLLPLISMVIIIALNFISSFSGRRLKMSSKELGVFLIGTMIFNNGFLIPFITAGFGREGLGRLFIFDLSNAILVYTWIYFIACKYGDKSASWQTAIKKVLIAPPLWALAVAFLMNMVQVTFKGVAYSFLDITGQLTIPLLMIALGLYFRPINKLFRYSIAAILIRMGAGFVIGFILAELAGLEGLNKAVVLICSAAPTGYNTLTYASLEGLDKELAASVVSYSILAGTILAPLMIWLLK